MSRRSRKPKLLHIGRLFPNMLTLLGLCAALTAVRFALAEKWDIAVGLVIIAAFMDGIDGRVARMLHSTSPFGAQLDSLCDTINFGVVPPILIFLWQTYEIKRFGWACVLFFAICCVLRLARFNTQLDNSGHSTRGERFFQGVPAPAGAILCLCPLMIHFWGTENIQLLNWIDSPIFLCLYMVFIGSLMISNIPTFSIKKLAFSPKQTRFVLLFVGVLFIILISEPWLAIPLVGLGYLLSLPASIYLAKRQEKKSRS
jgi:CDP-diacylglycerol--serine O-phosphatidyltransferase